MAKNREIEESNRKYDPHQPRVPAGNADGGEWTDGVGGGASGRVAVPKPKPLQSPSKPRLRFPERSLTREEIDRINSHAPEGTPPEWLEISPHTGMPKWTSMGMAKPVGNAITDTLTVVTLGEGTAALRLLIGRMRGRAMVEESQTKIRKAADSIEDSLGGRPDPKDVKINPSQDIIIIKGNKKFRMDVNNPGTKRRPNGTKVPEEPHFHLLEKRNGRWQDAGDQHRFFFKKNGLKE